MAVAVMPEISRILVPVDFSDCSDAALEYAVFLAGGLGASIDLLHAWHPPQDSSPFFGQLAIADPRDGRHKTLADFVEEQAREALDRVLARLKERGIDVRESVLVGGTPKRAIVEAASRGDYHMVIMGTHGRTGLSHVLMGSVAEWVLRHCTVPVLTVRATARRSGSGGSGEGEATGSG
jgi:nucleotide-binding universal stress UspA family protein